MTINRRTFLHTAAAVGTVTFIPFAARAEAHMGDAFETDLGPVTIHPVHHASIVIESPVGVIYVDPVGDAAEYEGLPAPDLPSHRCGGGHCHLHPLCRPRRGAYGRRL